MFRSFAWGGFEAASHLRADGERVDTLQGSGHERWAMLDGAILRALGVRTIREALRWHLVGEGERDWSSARAQIAAARAHGLQVVWDICHWGLPEGMNVMAPDWPRRLADFAVDAAAMLQREGCEVAGFVPVNEISFWAWAGAEVGGFSPYLENRGSELKRQLVAGHLAVAQALRAAGHTTPIMVCEPLIWVLPASDAGEDVVAAAAFIQSSHEAVGWILQADPAAIDVLGLNFYPHNQWQLKGKRVMSSDPRWRPLATLLEDVAARFALPIVLTETGAEEPMGDDWMAEVMREVAVAVSRGVPVQGVCVYPVADYPGWDNGRHCPCGPLGLRRGLRFVRPGQAAAMRALQRSRLRVLA